RIDRREVRPEGARHPPQAPEQAGHGSLAVPRRRADRARQTRLRRGSPPCRQAPNRQGPDGGQEGRMKTWSRASLVALFLAAGMTAGIGLGRVLDREPNSVASASERATNSGDLPAFQDSLASVAESVSPSVVHITTQVGTQGDPWQSEGVGSGVVVSSKG